MRFLENTELLKIEDILPFFPDFVVIDDFKEEICTALEGNSAHIDELKADPYGRGVNFGVRQCSISEREVVVFAERVLDTTLLVSRC